MSAPSELVFSFPINGKGAAQLYWTTVGLNSVEFEATKGALLLTLEILDPANPSNRFKPNTFIGPKP